MSKEIYVKDLTGRSLTVGVEYFDTMTICQVKSRIQEIWGISPTYQKLVYAGKRLTCVNFPKLKDDFSSSCRVLQNNDIVIGKGSRFIRAVFANVPNLFVTFRFDEVTSCEESEGLCESQSRVRSLLSSFCEAINEFMDCDVTDKNTNLVNLYCGDQMVCSIGHRVDQNTEEYVAEPQPVVSPQMNKFMDYYYARNDIWSISIQNYGSNLPTLSDYNIQNGATIHMILGYRRGRRGTTGCFGDYFESESPQLPVKRGINLIGMCTNQSCESYDNEVLFNYSFHFPNIEPVQSRESFDLKFDRSKCKCPKCNSIMIPLKCRLKSCYWKFSSIIRDKKTYDLKRIQTEWKDTEDSEEKIEENEESFDIKQFQEVNDVIRLQIQVRFYPRRKLVKVKREGQEIGVYRMCHPESTYCMFCRNEVPMRYFLERNSKVLHEIGEKSHDEVFRCKHFKNPACHLYCWKVWGDGKCLKCQTGWMNGIQEINEDLVDRIEFLKCLWISVIEENGEKDDVIQRKYMLEIDVRCEGNVFVPKLFL